MRLSPIPIAPRQRGRCQGRHALSGVRHLLPIPTDDSTVMAPRHSVMQDCGSLQEGREHFGMGRVAQGH